MPVRGTGGEMTKWNLAARWLPGFPVDRAELRLTATYAVMPNAFVGIEYNPLADDVGPLVNWRIVSETLQRPAVMVGTSSDRIGTTHGRAYYVTVAKDLQHYTDLPVAPYVGTAYGDFDDEWTLIAGLGIRWAPGWMSTHSWDGYNLHHMLDRFYETGRRIGVVLVEQESDYYAGVSIGVSL
jgi:hypothetical protein